MLREIVNKGNNTIILNYFEPNSQYVDHVENQYISLTPDPSTKRERKKGGEEQEVVLPDVLATEQAMALWKKVRQAGYVDDNYQPLLSRTQVALLADAMAQRLGIRHKWKTFETLWNRKYMYRDYYEAQDLRISLSFQDELRKLLA